MKEKRMDVNLEFSNGNFFFRILGRDFFHEALPQKEALQIGDLTSVTDYEQALLRKFIHIAGNDGKVLVFGRREIAVDIGRDLSPKRVSKKRADIISALKLTLGNKMEYLPPPRAGSYTRGEKLRFSFVPSFHKRRSSII